MKLIPEEKLDISWQARPNLFFHLRPTKDQSYTCFTSIGPSEEAKESMHSVEGAYTETDYIYGTAVRVALEQKLAPTFLNIGLGVGYNEIAILAHCLIQNIEVDKIQIHSYEIYEELNESLKNFFLSDAKSFFSLVYTDCLARTCDQFKLNPNEIVQLGKKLIQNKQWMFLSEATEQSHFELAASVLLFDAYSKQTSPSLWSEKFLNKVLASLAPQAIFSTYAATGVLNRALLNQDFKKLARKGFAFKRESSFAVRKLDEKNFRF